MTISTLSEEILLHIALFLDVKSLGRVARTCKRWQRISGDHSLWKSLSIIALVNQPKLPSCVDGQWKDWYRKAPLKNYVNYLKKCSLQNDFCHTIHLSGSYVNDFALEDKQLIILKPREHSFEGIPLGEPIAQYYDLDNGALIKEEVVSSRRIPSFNYGWLNTTQQLVKLDDASYNLLPPGFIEAFIFEEKVFTIYLNKICIFQKNCRDKIQEIALNTTVTSIEQVKLFRTKNHAVVIFDKKALYLVDIQSGIVIKAHTSTIDSGCINENYFFYYDKGIQQMDLKTGKITPLMDSEGGFISLGCSSTHVVFETALHFFRIRDLCTSTTSAMVNESPQKLDFFDFHENYLLAGTHVQFTRESKGTFYLIDMKKGKILQKFSCASDGARPRFYMGKIIVASIDTIQIWDLDKLLSTQQKTF